MEKLLLKFSKFFAGMTILLTILTCSILVLRLVIQKFGILPLLRPIVEPLNRLLHKAHIPLGILLIIASLLHGVFSWVSIFAPSWGSGGIVALFALGGTYLLRPILKGKWMLLHRVFAVLFIICLIIHVTVEVPAWKKERRNHPVPTKSEIQRVSPFASK